MQWAFSRGVGCWASTYKLFRMQTDSESSKKFVWKIIERCRWTAQQSLLAANCTVVWWGEWAERRRSDRTRAAESGNFWQELSSARSVAWTAETWCSTRSLSSRSVHRNVIGARMIASSVADSETWKRVQATRERESVCVAHTVYSLRTPPLSIAPFRPSSYRVVHSVTSLPCLSATLIWLSTHPDQPPASNFSVTDPLVYLKRLFRNKVY